MSLLTIAGCAPFERTPSSGATPSNSPAPSASASDHTEKFSALEERFDVTLGIYAIDTASGTTVEYRADDRFGFASTIKAVAAGFVLGTATDQQLHTPIPITAAHLVPYSPVIEESVGGTVTLMDAADAAVRFSDNAAANLLVAHLGGPAGLEQKLRAMGDETTTAVRVEPDLNDVVPGDDRDTSTPRAMATTLSALALGDVIDDDAQAILIDLLKRNTTGDALIRAGAPSGWVIGDKTGSAAFGTRDDIAIAWPPDGGAPVVLAILSRGERTDAEPVDELLAESASLVFEFLADE